MSRFRRSFLSASKAPYFVGRNVCLSRKRPRPTWQIPHAMGHWRLFASRERLDSVFSDSSHPSTMEADRLYRYLKLESYSRTEMERIFENIASSERDISDELSRDQVASFLKKRVLELEQASGRESTMDASAVATVREQFIQVETDRFFNFFGSEKLKKDAFADRLTESASSIDIRRTWPLTASMLLVGSSVGVVTPAMPFVVQSLGLTAGEYGLVVSAFALAKMTGNIPSAVLVERHGRKPYLVYTMSLIALGVGGVGLAGSFEHLYLCRLFTGLGVAGLSTAATMTVTDLSTPLNRASTFAPIMSAFAAGTALGPALGGVMVDSVGLRPTFYLVGASYVGLAFVNSMLLNETKPKPMEFPWQTKVSKETKSPTVRQSFELALGQWKPLLSEATIRRVCVMNACYWVALAGSQMTLLPLILTDPERLAMSATQVGQVYMGMSLVQVMGNPILAKVVDKVGKAPGIVGGCVLISASMGTLPFCTDLYQMGATLAVWAAGSSLLSTAPLAFVSDRVDDARRAQAIALLRTSGDVGFLIGASTMGALADWAGSLDLALQSSSAILFTATTWFGARQYLASKEKTL